MVHYGSISRYFQTHPNWAKRIAARIRQMSLIFWKCFGTSKAEVCSRNQSAGCWGCPMKHWVLAYKDRCQAVELFESLGAAQSSLPQLTTRHDGKTLDSSGTCIRLNWPTGARQFQGDKATYQPKSWGLSMVVACCTIRFWEKNLGCQPWLWVWPWESSHPAGTSRLSWRDIPQLQSRCVHTFTKKTWMYTCVHDADMNMLTHTYGEVSFPWNKPAIGDPPFINVHWLATQ